MILSYFQNPDSITLEVDILIGSDSLNILNDAYNCMYYLLTLMKRF